MSDDHGVALKFDDKPTATEHIRRWDDVPNLRTMEIPTIKYLVEGLIVRETITLWTGADGTAKTFLAQAMAIAVATGGTFLGRRCSQSPVLYLDYENPAFAIRQRLDLMAGDMETPLLKTWGTWFEDQPPQIGSDLLLSIAKETRPLIIVDPFRYAHGAEENDSTEMMGVMQMLRYCAAAGGAVVVLHHPSKAEGSTGRGSSVIRGAVDVAFQQELSDESGLITLRQAKNRFGGCVTVTIRPDFDRGSFEVTDSPQFTKRNDDMDRMRAIIESSPGLSQTELCRTVGIMKERAIELARAGDGVMWQAERKGKGIYYLPISSKTQNSFQNYRTQTAVEDGSKHSSIVLSPKGENFRTLRPDTQQPARPAGERLCSKHGHHTDWVPDTKGFYVCAKCHPPVPVLQ